MKARGATQQGGEGAHQFDRRTNDVNVASLATRMSGLEGRVEALEHKADDNKRELRANTVLTSQLHEAVFGRTEAPGLQAQLTEMYSLFTATRNGFRMIAVLGNFGLTCIEALARVAKPLLWLSLLAAAVFAYFKTGEWKIPAWP